MEKVLMALIFGLVLTMILISCGGGGGGDSIDPAWEEKIKTILLRSEGWDAEWLSSTNSVIVDLIFEDNGNKFEANIKAKDNHFKCKRKVTITSDGFEMAGCYVETVPLIYDSNDDRYPFKGDNGTWKLKLKAK